MVADFPPVVTLEALSLALVTEANLSAALAAKYLLALAEYEQLVWDEPSAA